MIYRHAPLFLAVISCYPLFTHAAEGVDLEPLVVTATRMSEPLTSVESAKSPRQPVPAHDGADYLKTVPGFSVIRKGGTDGDPVLRGMAGSRLNILLDGEQILGGCGGRMDPPTAYVFPEAYDRITVIKGPQTVSHGPGNSAGTVMFEREQKRFSQPGWSLYGSLLGGSFGRNDEVIDARVGNQLLDGRIAATRSDMNDYKDGSGNSIHSAYTRWSTNAVLGWNVNTSTRLELSGAKSDGEAAYADRAMDGSKFERDNIGLKLDMRKPMANVERVEAQLFHNYIDHVMDNYTLRDTTGMAMAMNPDRLTTGGRFALTLAPAKQTELKLGLDQQSNIHTNRSGTPAIPVGSKPRVEDANFDQLGLFGELTQYLSPASRVIAGLRADRWDAQDKRASVSVGSGMMAASVANPTAGEQRSDTLPSGFARYEQDVSNGQVTLFGGLGHVQRFPDYWELINKEATDSLSAFNTKPEKTTQIDAGLTGQWQGNRVGLSAFASRVSDFILIQSNYVKPAMMGSRKATVTRNVDASTWGFEANAGRSLMRDLNLDATLAYVRGENRSDDLPLAQLPPLEARLALNYDNKQWSVGGLWRMVAAQDRVAENQGNIAGQDIGTSAGFGVLSLNGGWKASKSLQLTAGIDNLFDKTYAEHISRNAAAIPGYAVQTTRVNEPGRNLWAKLTLALD